MVLGGAPPSAGAAQHGGERQKSDGFLPAAGRLFQAASQRGEVAGTCSLGLCYELGRGVDRDMDKALELYRQAAEHYNNTLRRPLIHVPGYLMGFHREPDIPECGCGTSQKTA